MDKEVNLTKFGFTPGDKVILVDDSWSRVGTDIIIVDVEPVPGSTQCVIRDNKGLRTVSRAELRLA